MSDRATLQMTVEVNEDPLKKDEGFLVNIVFVGEPPVHTKTMAMGALLRAFCEHLEDMEEGETVPDEQYAPYVAHYVTAVALQLPKDTRAPYAHTCVQHLEHIKPVLDMIQLVDMIKDARPGKEPNYSEQRARQNEGFLSSLKKKFTNGRSDECNCSDCQEMRKSRKEH